MLFIVVLFTLPFCAARCVRIPSLCANVQGTNSADYDTIILMKNKCTTPNTNDCWLHDPLTQNDRMICIIGCGAFAQTVFLRGLVVNAMPPDMSLTYHLFGDWSGFLKAHPQLDKTVSINTVTEGSDAVFFHEGTPESYADILESADRIINCPDDGAVKEPGNVNSSPDDVAICLNKLYCNKTGSNTEWNDLSEWHKMCNIAAADHLRTKLRLLLGDGDYFTLTPDICRAAAGKYNSLSDVQKEDCRRLEHFRWSRFYYLNNWIYAPVRNDELKHHPQLIPYDELTEDQKIKDDSAWEVFEELYSRSELPGLFTK